MKTVRITVGIDKERYLANEQIAIVFKIQGAISDANDWIGIYRAGWVNKQPIKSYLKYVYVPKELEQGNLHIAAPRLFGEYELRYIQKNTDGSWGWRCTSTKFLVGPKVSLQIVNIDDEDDHNPHVAVAVEEDSSTNAYKHVGWVGLYKEGERDPKRYISCEILSAKTPKKQIELRIPHAGSFQVRYFPTSGYHYTAIADFSFRGADELKLTEMSDESGQMLVHYKIRTIDVAAETIWIALYQSSVSPTAYLEYKYITDRTGKLTFAKHGYGSFIVKLHSKARKQVVLESDQLYLPAPPRALDKL
eukprot:TRINITY_DN6807_c0_g1_i2.p1 TRINITY_DN6807_c0_g1~~TRINITY_DN6807_c0_g1_i2.p1  ORF type:complete len:305 (-),score=34.28 TRINITY_DN6807_c0_g1_i2:85-999(-)